MLLFLLLLFQSVYSVKILVFSPKFGFSHMNFMGSIADTLQTAGHNVTVFQPILVSQIKGSGSHKAKVWEVEPSEPVKKAIQPLMEPDLWKAIWNSNIHNPMGILAPLPIMFSAFPESARNILTQPELIRRLKEEKYDMIITELFDYGGFLLKHELQIPTVVGVHTCILFDSTAKAMGIPVTPSFVPDSHGVTGDDGSFLTRVIRLYFGYATSYLEEGLIDVIQKFSNQHFKGKGPNIREMIGNLPLIFVNSEPLLDFPRPVMRKVIDIGGLSLKEGKPLDEKWKAILSKRPANVLISFGSVAPSKSMNQECKDNIARVVQKFSNVTFIWKYEDPQDGTGKGIENLELAAWTPQTDLLASDKIDLFITHGGAGSVFESATYGVPTVVVPLFGDQMRNARMLERFGSGLIYNKLKLSNEKMLADAIQQGLSCPKLKKKAKLAQRMLKARPFSPQEQLIRYIALAAEFDNLSTLSPAGRKFSYVHYWNLDILAVAVVIVLSFTLFVVWGMRRIVCSLLGRVSEAKSKNE